MKRVCKRPIQIDALTICYELVEPNIYETIEALEMGEALDMFDFEVQRIEGRYYNNVYSIRTTKGDSVRTWGFLKFNLSRGDEAENTHLNGLRKMWISLENETLYCDELYYLTYIEQRLGLAFHNVTSIDLCLDTAYNISRTIKRLLRDRNVTTILNGKKITDRDSDRPEIMYLQSGSLNEQGKYQSVSVKQKNAMKDKSKGLTLLTYDKRAEILNSSGKWYILEQYGFPSRLYRTEVHANSEEVKNYIGRRGIEYTPLLLFDQNFLEGMFFHFVSSVLRFQSDKAPVTWEYILGRSPVGI